MMLIEGCVDHFSTGLPDESMRAKFRPSASLKVVSVPLTTSRPAPDSPCVRNGDPEIDMGCPPAWAVGVVVRVLTCALAGSAGVVGAGPEHALRRSMAMNAAVICGVRLFMVALSRIVVSLVD
jgi:hypothetical protein